MRVTPGMRASVSPRRGQTIREMRKGADEKLILDVQPGYVVVQNNHNGNYSLLRRKTLWRYEVTAVPHQGSHPILVNITNVETGEMREWSMSLHHTHAIYRALKAHSRVADYMAERFNFMLPGRRRRTFL